MKITKEKYNFTQKNGITLIALVITIIVLLILAGVTISTLTGDNGILTQTKKAKENTDTSSEEERIKLAIQEAKIEVLGRELTKDVLEKALNKEFGSGKVTVTETDDNKFSVTIVDTENTYIVDQEGNINKGESEAIIEQVTDTNPGAFNGAGTQGDPYLVESIEDLVFLSTSTNAGTTYEGKYIKLATHLDFESTKSYANPENTTFGDLNKDGSTEGLKTELTKRTGRTTEHQEGFIPIGSINQKQFSGNFDGNQKWIKNIYQEWYESTANTGILARNYLGLFGYAKSNSAQIIENIKIAGNYTRKQIADNSQDFCQGGIVGSAENTMIKNCNSWVTQENIILSESNTSQTGGICGQASAITIENCNNYGTIQTTQGGETGGIIGYSTDNKIKASANYSLINGKNNVGGIIGMSSAGDYIENCINQAQIQGEDNIGGIVGNSTPGIIYCGRKNKNQGKVIGKTYVGGIIGNCCWIDDSQSEAGYYQLENAGEVQGENSVGGIIGEIIEMDIEGTLLNTYNTGNVSGINQVGGIIGNVLSGQANIDNAVNAGNINGNECVGGIIGSTQEYPITKSNNLYNLGEIKGKNKVGGIEGETFYIIENCKNFFNLGKITGDTNANAIIGMISGMNASDFISGVTGISNFFYQKGTANQASNFGDVAGFEAKDTISATEIVNLFNENVTTLNTKHSLKILEWKIDSQQNNGYPILEEE